MKSDLPKRLFSSLVRKEYMKSLSPICLTQDQAAKLMSKQKKQNLQKPCPQQAPVASDIRTIHSGQVENIAPFLWKSAPGQRPLSWGCAASWLVRAFERSGIARRSRERKTSMCNKHLPILSQGCTFGFLKLGREGRLGPALLPGERLLCQPASDSLL